MLRVMTNCPPKLQVLIESVSVTKWHKTDKEY